MKRQYQYPQTEFVATYSGEAILLLGSGTMHEPVPARRYIEPDVSEP